jgi:hypothetical protein
MGRISNPFETLIGRGEGFEEKTSERVEEIQQGSLEEEGGGETQRPSFVSRSGARQAMDPTNGFVNSGPWSVPSSRSDVLSTCSNTIPTIYQTRQRP